MLPKKMMCQHLMSMTIVRCAVAARLEVMRTPEAIPMLLRQKNTRRGRRRRRRRSRKKKKKKEEDPFPDFDNYVFDTSTFDDEETRKKYHFLGMLIFTICLPSLDRRHCHHTQPTHSLQRRGRVKAEQVFRSKPEMTLALGMKFLEEGFEFKTIRTSKHKYEAVCVYDNCGWRIYATSIGSSRCFKYGS
ncbi:hypothetical protein OSB04_017153 [Centaurea solstitialis]|uniref:Transposase MuDR plant domain-containing protein n=1 Tax=Centaurea solstitialis TaxID=347529 RepID=A0AA38T2D6_9ASTR|nr:hypothetical protein OSB04_017153 [Centaurea solstitialis]